MLKYADGEHVLHYCHDQHHSELGTHWLAMLSPSPVAVLHANRTPRNATWKHTAEHAVRAVSALTVIGATGMGHGIIGGVGGIAPLGPSTLRGTGAPYVRGL